MDSASKRCSRPIRMRRIIWSHRDPVQAIASRIVLIGELIEGIVRPRSTGRPTAPQQLAGARASFSAASRDPLVQDPRIYHVRYPDFVAIPSGRSAGFYERYGVPFTSEIETAMREYLANNKGDRYGKFHYSTDVIGEDIDALNAEFAPYRERFGLEIERRK